MNRLLDDYYKMVLKKSIDMSCVDVNAIGEQYSNDIRCVWPLLGAYDASYRLCKISSLLLTFLFFSVSQI